MSGDGIQWGPPPPPSQVGGGAKGLAAHFVDALRQRPGEWARYPKRVSSSAASQMKLRYPGTEWVRRTCDESPKRFDVYGRWVGES